MTTSAYIARVRESIERAKSVSGGHYNIPEAPTELSRLCRALEVADRALERVAKIRTLPLTDIHDTDAEIASQYSSVLDTLVYGAKEARAEVERILNEELK